MGPRLAHATPSACDAMSGNLIANCGFEAAGGAAAAYPQSWTTDSGYALHANVDNQVVTYDLHTGLNGLKFGNLDTEVAAGISQTVMTLVGATYAVTFWTYTGQTTDAGANFDARVDGTSQIHLVGDAQTAGTYAQYGYSFVGTGSDTIGFLAQSNPSEWYLDDIAVVQSAAAPGGGSPGTAVPEPMSLTLLGVSALSLVSLRLARRHRA